MASNTEMIDQLVSPQALKDFDLLDKKLISSYEEMEKTLAVVQKLNVEFNTLGKNFREASKYAEASEKMWNSAAQSINNCNKASEEYHKHSEQTIKGKKEEAKATNESTKASEKATAQEEHRKKATEASIDADKEKEKAAQNASKAEEDKSASIQNSAQNIQRAYEDTNRAIEVHGQTLNSISLNAIKQAREEQSQLTKDLGIYQSALSGVNDLLKINEEKYKKGVFTFEEYNTALVDLNRRKRDLQDNIKQLNRDLDLNKKIIYSSIESYDSLSAQYSKLKIQINQMDDSEKINGKTKEELNAQAKALYERMNELQQATGKSQLQVGNYALANKELTGALNTVSPALGSAVSGIQSMTAAAMAFIATPLGLVLAAIAAVLATLSAWFTRTEEGQSALAVGTAAFEKVLSSILNVATEVGEWLYKAFTTPKEALTELSDFIKENLMNRLRALGLMGEAIVKIFSGDLAEGAKDLGNAVLQLSTGVEDMIGKTSDWINETYEGAQRAAEIQRQMNDLSVKKRELELEESARQAEMNKLRNDANDMEKSLSERLAANNKYMEIANGLGEKKKDIAQQELELRRAQILENKQETEMSIAEKEELNKLAIAVNKTDAEHQQKMFTATRTNNRLRKEGINAQKEAMRERNKELKSMGELESFNYRKSADLQASLFKDATLGYEERKDALLSYIADEKRIIEIKQAEEVKQEGLTETQKKLIKEKALYEIYKLELKQTEELKNLKVKAAEDELKIIQDGISARSEQMNQYMQDDLVKEAKNYEKQIAQNKDNVKKREQITEEYQRRRMEIIRKYHQDAFEYEVEQLQKSLDNTELTEDKKLEIYKKIDALRKKNAKELAEFEIKETEDKVDKMMSLESRLNDFLSNQRTQAIMTMWSQSLDIMNMYYDGQLQRIDELERREQEYWEDKLAYIDENVQAGLMSEEEADARRSIIEETQREREKKFEQERKEVQRKQALWEKANSIVQATIATSLGVAKAAPNLVLMGLIGALGAAQIAMIASQKIPEYAKGTDFHKGGLAWVGDGGKSEMVILPSGEVWKTPNKDTLVNLPRGTEVLPDYKQAILNMGAQSPISYYDDNTGKMVVMKDEVLRNNTRETNAQLASINKGINAIRSNNMYTSQKTFLGSSFTNNTFND